MSLSARIHADREAKRQRQSKKATHAVVRNPEYDRSMFYMTLSRSGTSSTDQRDVDTLCVGPLAQLERLRTGCLDATGFLEICEACTCAYEISNEILLHAAGQDTRDLMEAMKPELLVAGDVLGAIAERHTTSGKWITKGGELGALQAILAPGGYYEQLILASDRGLVCRALRTAARAIQGVLAGGKK